MDDLAPRVTTPFGARSTAYDILREVDLTGRRYLVTGGASGIGAETVRALAAAGAEVTVGSRDADRASLFAKQFGRAGGAVIVEMLDLSDLRSVRRFTEQWEGGLDGVVANAGVMALPHRQLSAERWELQLATNYLGHFALVTGLHDALASAAGRVAVVSSTAHLRSPFVFEDPQFERRPYERWSAYAQSKTADVLLAVGLANRWADEGITANALMPGWISTNLQRHLDDDTLRSMGAMDESGNRIEPGYFKTPEQGAATSVLLAASPWLEGVTGLYFEDNQQAEVVVDTEGRTTGVAAHAIDPAIASKLWEYSESEIRNA